MYKAKYRVIVLSSLNTHNPGDRYSITHTCCDVIGSEDFIKLSKKKKIFLVETITIPLGLTFIFFLQAVLEQGNGDMATGDVICPWTSLSKAWFI